MAKARVKVRPTGLINGKPWPAVGEVIDLPDVVVDDMVGAGALERVDDEKPETATKPTQPEKRPGRGRPRK